MQFFYQVLSFAEISEYGENEMLSSSTIINAELLLSKREESETETRSPCKINQKFCNYSCVQVNFVQTVCESRRCTFLLLKYV